MTSHHKLLSVNRGLGPSRKALKQPRQGDHMISFSCHDFAFVQHLSPGTNWEVLPISRNTLDQGTPSKKHMHGSYICLIQTNFFPHKVIDTS